MICDNVVNMRYCQLNSIPRISFTSLLKEKAAINPYNSLQSLSPFLVETRGVFSCHKNFLCNTVAKTCITGTLASDESMMFQFMQKDLPSTSEADNKATFKRRNRNIFQMVSHSKSPPLCTE